MKLLSEKRIFCLVFGCLLMLSASALFAQEDTAQQKSRVIIRTYHIDKIYVYPQGYRIDVFDYLGELQTIVLKSGWFNDSALRNPDSETFELLATMNYVKRSKTRLTNYLLMRYEDGDLKAVDVYADDWHYYPGREIQKPLENSVWIVVDDGLDVNAQLFEANTVSFIVPPDVPVSAIDTLNVGEVGSPSGSEELVPDSNDDLVPIDIVQ